MEHDSNVHDQAHREPQQGPGKHFRGAPKTCSFGPSEEKFFEFFFSKWCILVYFVLLSDGGAPQALRGLG